MGATNILMQHVASSGVNPYLLLDSGYPLADIGNMMASQLPPISSYEEEEGPATARTVWDPSTTLPVPEPETIPAPKAA